MLGCCTNAYLSETSEILISSTNYCKTSEALVSLSACKISKSSQMKGDLRGYSVSS